MKIQKTIADIGEKEFIQRFIKPYFNSSNDPAGVGDDCAMLDIGETTVLFSTDRVPADLTAFVHGILDHRGLGDYLARLNLSDIAACGGDAVAMLLNLGIPEDLAEHHVEELCCGFGDCAQRFGVPVLGGDMTIASELSVSATSIGQVPRGRAITRRGACPGDSIFLSRPLGLTPTAFCALHQGLRVDLSKAEIETLDAQFKSMAPMLGLGAAFSASGRVSSCMDNTDGVGQSLFELAEASNCAFIVDESSLRFRPIVEQVCRLAGVDPINIVFDGGADFSLVGTLAGRWTSDSARESFGDSLEVIGFVESGEGVWLQSNERKPLKFSGWNYFASSPNGNGE